MPLRGVRVKVYILLKVKSSQVSVKSI